MKIKLLLADDHQMLLDGLKAFLQDHPEMEVTCTARNGRDALNLLKQYPVDVAILDITMQEVDGLEAALEIRRDYPYTKIILLTMHDDGYFIQQAMNLGVHAYILKEKSKELLIQTIKRVFNGDRYYSPELFAKMEQKNLTGPKKAISAPKFTDREEEAICILVKEGNLKDEELGSRMGIAGLTARTHLRNAMAKLGVRTKLDLVTYAIRIKLCD